MGTEIDRQEVANILANRPGADPKWRPGQIITRLAKRYHDRVAEIGTNLGRAIYNRRNDRPPETNTNPRNTEPAPLAKAIEDASEQDFYLSDNFGRIMIQGIADKIAQSNGVSGTVISMGIVSGQPVFFYVDQDHVIQDNFGNYYSSNDIAVAEEQLNELLNSSSDNPDEQLAFLEDMLDHAYGADSKAEQ